MKKILVKNRNIQFFFGQPLVFPALSGSVQIPEIRAFWWQKKLYIKRSLQKLNDTDKSWFFIYSDFL